MKRGTALGLIIEYEAVGKRPSASLPSPLVTAAYFSVRLIPQDFGSLASGHFPSASEKPVFPQSLLNIEIKDPPSLLGASSRQEQPPSLKLPAVARGIKWCAK